MELQYYYHKIAGYLHSSTRARVLIAIFSLGAVNFPLALMNESSLSSSTFIEISPPADHVSASLCNILELYISILRIITKNKTKSI